MIFQLPEHLRFFYFLYFYSFFHVHFHSKPLRAVFNNDNIILFGCEHNIRNGRSGRETMENTITREKMSSLKITKAVNDNI